MVPVWLRRFDLRRQPAEEVARAVRRPPLVDMPVGGPAAERLRAVFGPGVTPQEAVRRIVASVRAEGDRALVRWCRELDGVDLQPQAFYLSEAQVQAAWTSPYRELVPSLRQALAAIEQFHRRQLPAPVMELTGPGVWAAWIPRPVRRAAVYVPAGGAPLLSTALMGVVPARIAGVAEIVVVTPPPAHPSVVLAASVAGAHRVLQLGGAQAIAAVAFGTETVQPVDVVVGPGNLFVQLAKREVVGTVGIDGLAGPTEVIVMADRAAPPEWVAADLLAQAEHAPDAACILVTDHPPLAEAVDQALERQLGRLPRADVAASALRQWGAAVLCRQLAEDGVELVEALAPEHVELMVEDALGLAGRIGRAGAVFVGPYTPEALGDYAAGTNHILPTNGTARFASALSVQTFLRSTSLLAASGASLARLAPVVAELARAEGLEAHARSVEIRLAGADGPGPEGAGS